MARLPTSCVLNVLAKPQKQIIFISCGGLRVLAAQELLGPLLARALFLGGTVPHIPTAPTILMHNIFKIYKIRLHTFIFIILISNTFG